MAMNDNGWRGGKRDNNDGPPDLDEIFRSLNQKLSRLLGGRGGQGGGSPDGGRALFKGGASLAKIVDALNLLGTSPSDLAAILEALKQAGALKAEMVVL